MRLDTRKTSSQILRCAAGFLLAGAGNTSALAVEAPEKFLEGVIAESSCRATQYDGLAAGGARQDNLLVLLDCGDDRRVVALVQGPYPLASTPSRTEYHVLAKKEIRLAAGENADLASGVCSDKRASLLETVVIHAKWGKNKRISIGKGLIEIMGATADHHDLRSLPSAGLSCWRDEP